MALTPLQLTIVFAVTSIAGVLMFFKGLADGLLERRPTRCRACGGVVGRTCSCKRD